MVAAKKPDPKPATAPEPEPTPESEPTQLVGERLGVASVDMDKPPLGERDGRFHYSFFNINADLLTDEVHTRNAAETVRQAINNGWRPTGPATETNRDGDQRVTVTYSCPVRPNLVEEVHANPVVTGSDTPTTTPVDPKDRVT
jgi:hypothetical protein